jgi:multimeric flavodoxin WrbA
MQLIIISGSRNPEGQTARAAIALAEGAASAGCACETIYLPALQIERCRQCDNDGWGQCRQGEACVIEDDLAETIQKISAADAVVFATPVYFADLSESLRAFLDRVRRIATHAGEKSSLRGKPAVGLCVAGGGGGGAPRCAEALEFALYSAGFDVIDMIPARRQNLAAKVTVLRQVGEWLASRATP